MVEQSAATVPTTATEFTSNTYRDSRRTFARTLRR